MYFIRTALIIVAAVALGAPVRAQSPPPAPEGTHIEVTAAGHGEPPLILIPGLGCPGAVWDSTVAHFEGGHTCYVVSMAGFGGLPPGPKTDHLLDDVTAEIVAYARAHELQKPVIIGHSLGGVLALKMAIAAPDLPGRLVIVDSLPFLAGVMSPGVTDADAARPIAEKYGKMLAGETPEQFAAGQKYFVGGMITSPEKAAEVEAMTAKSDPPTTGQAMGELLGADLRTAISAIKCPVLVLIAVADKVAAGLTAEKVEAAYRQQYSALPQVRFKSFEHARHFIMVDDPEGFFTALREELAGP
jgi:pimeloyl-ACP methyl ester carboxylesterase